MQLKKRKSSLSKFSKIEKFLQKQNFQGQLDDYGQDENIQDLLSGHKLIVKTNIPNYAPAGLKVVVRIDEYLFTALFDEVSLGDIESLQNDPEIVSVMIASDLRLLGEEIDLEGFQK